MNGTFTLDCRQAVKPLKSENPENIKFAIELTADSLRATGVCLAQKTG
ncbi:hypothetical protein [Altericista sp. CCNU0014]